MFLDDLSFKIVRMHRANLSRFALFKTTKKFSFNVYRNENHFLHDIPLYPMNRNHTATYLKLSTFHSSTRKSSVAYGCVSFFVQYILQDIVHYCVDVNNPLKG